MGDMERTKNYEELWNESRALPGCRIAKHIELVEKLRATINHLHEYYKKPLAESKHLGAIEMEAESQLDANIQVENLGTKAIADLEAVHRRDMTTIDEDQSETVLGLCLTTLGDMQIIADDFFKEIVAIREKVSNFDKWLIISKCEQ